METGFPRRTLFVMTPDEARRQPSYGAAKETWWWKSETGGNIILKCLLTNYCIPSRNFGFSCKTVAFPQETLWSLAKHLCLCAQLLHFPEKLWVLSQNIHLQNYCVTLRNFVISCKTFAFTCKTIGLPEKLRTLSQNYSVPPRNFVISFA